MFIRKSTLNLHEMEAVAATYKKEGSLSLPPTMNEQMNNIIADIHIGYARERAHHTRV